jgi:hypothetical protein
MRVLTMLAAAVALAIATGAAHAQAKKNHPAAKPRGSEQSNQIRAGDRVIGTDPDAFIRGEILRHKNSGWPD